MDSLSLSWWAVQTRLHFESTAARALTDKAYDVFAPTYRVRTSHRGKLKEMDRPLFPGYIFCKQTPLSRGYIISTPGVIKLLTSEGHPASLDTCEIDRIRRIVNSPMAREPWRYLTSGTYVRIDNGPLKGLEGNLISGSGYRLFVVSLRLLVRSVAAVLDVNTTLSVIRGPRNDNRDFL